MDNNLPPEIVQARQNAQNLTGVANKYAAAEPSISDVLRQKVNEAYANNTDIVAPLDQATQTYLGAPQVAREKYADVFDPFARERLVSQYVGTEALPMLSLSNIYGQRMGRIDDTIGAGIRGFQSETLARQGAADQANNVYKTLLDEYSAMQSIKLEEKKLALEREKMNKASSSSANDAAAAMEFLKLFGLVPGGTTGAGDERESLDSAVEDVPVETKSFIEELGGNPNLKDPLAPDPLLQKLQGLTGVGLAGSQPSGLNIVGSAPGANFGKMSPLDPYGNVIRY